MAIKFDSNLAWKDAIAAISANREVLLALAGVFFMLPSLAFALLFPVPEPNAAMTAEQQAAMTMEFLRSAAPLIIPMAVLQAAGTLTLLTLLTDRARPTVGQAIKLGFVALVPYVLAQILFGGAVALLGSLLLGLAAAIGSPALGSVIMAMVMAGLIYGVIRIALVPTAIAMEHLRNPVAAIKRSWALTEGNAGRIALFFVMLFVALLVVTVVLQMLIGTLLLVIAGAEGARVGIGIVSSAVSAIITLYLVAVLASIHRQLAGTAATDQIFD